MDAVMDSLRVIIFQEGKSWVAQAIEVDVCASGNNITEVKQRFLQTLHAELKFGALANVGPAPDRFRRMWDEDRAHQIDHAKRDGGGSVEFDIAA